MNEINGAIAEIEKRIVLCEKEYAEQVPEYLNALKLAKAALLEKADREKGCEFCRMVLDDYPYIIASSGADMDSAIYEPVYCPICGKRLRNP